MKVTRKTGILLLCCAAVILAGICLLRSDSSIFMKWWLAALILGIGFFPLTGRLFQRFDDKGWIFSKVIGVAASGFVGFILIALGIGKFTSVFVLGCTLGLIALCWILYYVRNKKSDFRKGILQTGTIDLDLILLEEFLFLLLFLIWTYLAGFHPEAYGTEKYMDYGFMAAMMRDSSLPARDLWYSTGTINYYYGGQYFAVFLTRLTGTDIAETYNIMRTYVAAFAFVLPFGIVYQAMKDRKPASGKNGPGLTAGIFAGAAVSLAGNMHYVLYGLFGNVFKLSGYEDYWFPSSTRYIGHNPVTNDQCIHEFPSYSFVLGDLHAHVVNIMFVLLFAGLLYAWFQKKEEQLTKDGAKEGIKAVILDPHLWMMGALLGMFQLNNYWDFIIYLTVAIIAFGLLMFRHKTEGRMLHFLLRIVLVGVVAFAAALPFNLSFETMIGGIAPAKEHSAFYQLVILWGLPVLAVLLLFAYTIIRHQKQKKAGYGKNYVAGLTLTDLFMLLIGICGIGLVLVPEVMYAVDIYEDGYSRCNTMFKMTYQAYILFGMSMIYSLFRLGADIKRRSVRITTAVLTFLFVLTCGYFPYAVNCWFGNVLDSNGYQGLDATAFLENKYPEDAQAIRWLNENIEGNPVVLEANGDSYSDWQRVSAMTGLPTIEGWFVHEWLWRNDPQDLAIKGEDVRTIYTSGDAELVKEKIREYEVAYIFVGSCERQSFPEIQEATLLSLGEVVFVSDGKTDAASYVIKVALDQ